MDHSRAEILGQSIPIGPATVETPPLQVTGLSPTDDGLELSVKTALGHTAQPVRLTRSANQQPEGFPIGQLRIPCGLKEAKGMPKTCTVVVAPGIHGRSIILTIEHSQNGV